jgi:uncharacterized protein YjbJ (UPF0337 family)
MKSLRQFRRFILSFSLAIALSAIATFGLGTAEAIPLSFSSPPFSSAGTSQEPVVALFGWGKANAEVKQVEGAVQETVGNVTGDPKDQMMGQAKQVGGQIQGAAADMEGQMQLQGRAKAVTQNIEGNVQESMGEVTGSLSDQMAGRAKQLESQVRNTVEDIKDISQDMLN